MNDRTDPSKEYNQSIIANIVREYPQLRIYSDRWLLEQYDDYSMSDKSGTFLEWVGD